MDDGEKSEPFQMECICDQGWAGFACEDDMLNSMSACSALDASCNKIVPPSEEPCLGRADDYSMENPCADPRRVRIPYAPIDPPELPGGAETMVRSIHALSDCEKTFLFGGEHTVRTLQSLSALTHTHLLPIFFPHPSAPCGQKPVSSLDLFVRLSHSQVPFMSAASDSEAIKAGAIASIPTANGGESETVWQGTTS
jgi:hypothetical protein